MAAALNIVLLTALFKPKANSNSKCLKTTHTNRACLCCPSNKPPVSNSTTHSGMECLRTGTACQPRAGQSTTYYIAAALTPVPFNSFKGPIQPNACTPQESKGRTTPSCDVKLEAPPIYTPRRHIRFSRRSVALGLTDAFRYFCAGLKPDPEDMPRRNVFERGGKHMSRLHRRAVRRPDRYRDVRAVQLRHLPERYRYCL